MKPAGEAESTSRRSATTRAVRRRRCSRRTEAARADSLAREREPLPERAGRDAPEGRREPLARARASQKNLPRSKKRTAASRSSTWASSSRTRPRQPLRRELPPPRHARPGRSALDRAGHHLQPHRLGRDRDLRGRRQRRGPVPRRVLGIEPGPSAGAARARRHRRCARTAEIYLTGRDDNAGLRLEEKDLSACIPLHFDGRLLGVVAIFRLLPQKTGLVALDHELFDLLATHAARALYCTELQSRVAGASR